MQKPNRCHDSARGVARMPVVLTIATVKTSRTKILPLNQMRIERQLLQSENRTLVFTSGCFDALNASQACYLAFAKSLGDALVVGLNSDASVKHAQSSHLPVHNENDRAFLLAALEAVDYVVIFDEDKPDTIVAALLPDVRVKHVEGAHCVSGREAIIHGGRSMARFGPHFNNIAERKQSIGPSCGLYGGLSEHHGKHSTPCQFDVTNGGGESLDQPYRMKVSAIYKRQF